VGKPGRLQDRLASLTGQGLQAAGQIDVPADHRKVEPLTRPDVAVMDLAVMQADPGPQLRIRRRKRRKPKMNRVWAQAGIQFRIESIIDSARKRGQS
jgi:hypothetical protein